MPKSRNRIGMGIQVALTGGLPHGRCDGRSYAAKTYGQTTVPFLITSPVVPRITIQVANSSALSTTNQARHQKSRQSLTRQQRGTEHSTRPNPHLLRLHDKKGERIVPATSCDMNSRPHDRSMLLILRCATPLFCGSTSGMASGHKKRLRKRVTGGWGIRALLETRGRVA